MMVANDRSDAATPAGAYVWTPDGYKWMPAADAPSPACAGTTGAQR